MKIAKLLLLTITLLVLASCGTSKDAPTTGSEEPEENISTKITLMEDGEASFNIKNESKEEIILTMSSSQLVEFQLLNKEMAVIYTYSANKMFMEAIQEKKLQPEEEWTIPLNLGTELAVVPPGSYTLVVWSTAEGLSDLKAEEPYELTAPGKLVVQTQEVTFIGLQDPHSIEVRNLEGTIENMQLSMVAMPLFEKLEEGTQLIIEYVIENEQKVVQTTYPAE